MTLVSPILKLSLIALMASLSSLAQSVTPAIVASGYGLATAFNVAPGQLVTLVVHLDPSNGLLETVRAPGNADLPGSLAGFSGGYAQLGQQSPMAFLEIHPYWGSGRSRDTSSTTLAAVTLQIPFEAICDTCANGVSQGAMSVFQGASHGPFVSVYTFLDQAHVLTNCDAFLIPQAISAPSSSTGLPCASVVTHTDGSPISAKSPATPGEVVVAYAVGLGQTNPPLQTGKLVTAAAPTQTTYLLNFNYHPNALATKPLAGSPQPIYAGATPGYVGLYQVNFTVPQPPAGTPPCVDSSAVPAGANVVYSNLTVSMGGQSSFDAARLCVAVPNQ